MKFDEFESALAAHGVHPDEWPTGLREEMLSLIAVNRKADGVIRTYARIAAGLDQIQEPGASPNELSSMAKNVMMRLHDRDDEVEFNSRKFAISIAASFFLGLLVAYSELGYGLSSQLFGEGDVGAEDVAYSAFGYETLAIKELKEEGENNETN